MAETAHLFEIYWHPMLGTSDKHLFGASDRCTVGLFLVSLCHEVLFSKRGVAWPGSQAAKCERPTSVTIPVAWIAEAMNGKYQNLPHFRLHEHGELQGWRFAVWARQAIFFSDTKYRNFGILSPLHWQEVHWGGQGNRFGLSRETCKPWDSRLMTEASPEKPNFLCILKSQDTLEDTATGMFQHLYCKCNNLGKFQQQRQHANAFLVQSTTSLMSMCCKF
eukprot:1161386-Pelagomonas_calceolata.AAC.4